MQNSPFDRQSCTIHITSKFWTDYQKLVRHVAIPYQWEALNDRVPDSQPSHAIDNLKIAAGLAQGEFYGMVFQDSDLAKWLEAVAYSLVTCPNDEMEQNADDIIDLLEKAQWEDGYLNSYYSCKEPDNRWTNTFECHELYCAGHLIEAATAYFHATGKRKFMDLMCRYADHIATVFGTGSGQLRGYAGHEEIELALVKLYRATNNRKYLDLAIYFIDERGKQPYFFDAEWENRGKISYWSGKQSAPPSQIATYNQTHLPVREQQDAVGHAVRAVYLYTAMAEIARETEDIILMNTCRRLWRSIVERQMYITGGIGSMHELESFSLDFDLPSDTAYAETCASIGLIFFAKSMLQGELKGQYADVMERALYNTVLAGMAQDGRTFFYVNPLEVWPEASKKNLDKKHVLAQRAPWFSCACCPPNIIRLISSIDQYIYTIKNNVIAVNLYIGSELETVLDCGKVRIKQEIDNPLDDHVGITVISVPDSAFTIALRIPSWCDDVKIFKNGFAVALNTILLDGYAYISAEWKPDDYIELELLKSPTRMRANPLVRSAIGKVALQYGPLIYCLEECDNENNLHQLVLPDAAELVMSFEESLFGGTYVISSQGHRQEDKQWDNCLYQSNKNAQFEPVTLKFLPYYLWANRELGEMTVWVREGNCNKP